MAFGILVFVIGTLVVVDAWGVVDAKMATSSGAREAARAYVEGPSQQGALRDANQAVAVAMNGRRTRSWQLTVRNANGSAGYDRCGQVVAEVSTDLARVPLPLLRRAAGTFRIQSSHTEVVDPYRAGIPGTAKCDQP